MLFSLTYNLKTEFENCLFRIASLSLILKGSVKGSVISLCTHLHAAKSKNHLYFAHALKVKVETVKA